jgi:hypothetical protein
MLLALIDSSDESKQRVATATIYFKVGSRTHGRDTKLCVGKEKYPKEIRPMPLASCAPSVLSGFAGRDSCPSSKVRHPCRTPSGYSRQIRQCSERHKGINRTCVR